jgi:pectate lyase
VVIKRSKVRGRVDSGSAGSVTIQDSEVDRGQVQEAAVGNSNITVVRSNIHGGQTSVNCTSNCTIRDSWLHGQYMPPGGDWHLDAFLTNGGTNITLIHNTLACDLQASPGGCSGDAAIFGDFGPNSHITFDNNLFVASMHLSYCLYGGSQDNKPYGDQADHIVVINNVFQRGSNGKCGQHGPEAHFDKSRPGNRWENNTWDDGRPLTT